MWATISSVLEAIPIWILIPVALVAATIASFFLFVLRCHIRIWTSPLQCLPSPKHELHWLFGFLNRAINDEAMSAPMGWTKQYGTTVWYYSFPWRIKLLTSDPDMLQRVLTKNAANYPKPDGYIKNLQIVVGTGLLTTPDGAYHRKQRSMLSSHFQFTNLKAIVPVFVRKAAELAKVWEGRVGQVIDVNERMANLTLDVIGISGFGFEFGAVQKPDNGLAKAFKAMLPSLGPALIVQGLMPSLGKYLPFPTLIAQHKAIGRVQGMVREVVNAKMEQVARDTAAGKKPGEHTSLLDIMVHDTYRDGTKMTAEELQDQTRTFMMAGHETTSNGMTWAFMLLDKHPRVLRKMREEIDREFPGDSVESMTADDLHRLPYLWAVVQEVLRLYPPAPLTSRMTKADDEWTLQGKKVTVPKGTEVYICPFVVHRVKEFWGEDAEEFRPERWYLDDAMTVRLKPKMFTYMPFLFGQRSCIGQRFALMEMQAMLAVLVQKFHLKAVPGRSWRRKLFITMSPSPHLHMTIERRPSE